MPESKKVNIRLGSLEELIVKNLKIYLGDLLEKDPEKVTDTEAITYAIRYTMKGLTNENNSRKTN